jgi:hypothetical protein
VATVSVGSRLWGSLRASERGHHDSFGQLERADAKWVAKGHGLEETLPFTLASTNEKSGQLH